MEKRPQRSALAIYSTRGIVLRRKVLPMNFDESFHKIISHIKDEMPQAPPMSCTLYDLNGLILRLNETSMYLAEFIALCLNDEEETIRFPQDLIDVVPDLVNNCLAVSEAIHDITCDACNGDTECDND